MLLYHFKEHYNIKLSDSILRRASHKMVMGKRLRYILVRRDPKREEKRAIRHEAGNAHAGRNGDPLWGFNSAWGVSPFEGLLG